MRHKRLTSKSRLFGDTLQLFFCAASKKSNSKVEIFIDDCSQVDDAIRTLRQNKCLAIYARK